VIDEPVEPVKLSVELVEPEGLGAPCRPGGPPEVMFGHFFVVAALDEPEEPDEPDDLEELLDALFDDVELELAEEVLTPDEEPDFGSV
jgi:hypothetical protein